MNPLPATITIPAPGQPFLTADEVGKVFGVSGKTVTRWVMQGEFPAPIKVHGKPVWPARTVAVWIAYQEIKPTQPASESIENDDDSE